MCVVSAIMDYGKTVWPGLGDPWVNGTPPPIVPNLLPIDISPSPHAKPDWIKLIDAAKQAAEETEKAKQAEAKKIVEAERGEVVTREAAPNQAERAPTIAQIEAFLKLVEAAEAFDFAADQPHCEDPEKIKLLAALEERLRRLRLSEASLYGSTNLPSHIGIGETQVQLGEIVRRAFKDSGLTVEQWNAEDETVREHRLVDAIAAMRKEVAA